MELAINMNTKKKGHGEEGSDTVKTIILFAIELVKNFGGS